ncbi:MAG: orotate phosphoribosyltransferase [Thermosynechococcaceae cyanobacterium MS004]|nr:orotate phosphoribosyltransferase [Thermosynechococcaceae cyanobacterium MS004]
MTQFTSPSPTDLASASLPELKEILLNLLCTKAYKEGDFTLSSGQKSTYYINGKLVTLDPVGALALGRLMLDWVADSAQAIAGLTLGADPMISAISVVSVYEGRPISGLIIRKEAKGHGTQAYIEGPLPAEGSEIAVVEDVVTTGQSALKAVHRLQDAGYTVTQVLALVDREQGGAAVYAEAGLAFNALFKISDLQQRWRVLYP